VYVLLEYFSGALYKCMGLLDYLLIRIVLKLSENKGINVQITKGLLYYV